MANKARIRRKAMLRNRLEPVIKTVIRKPYDTTMAKSGLVHFVDADDKLIAAVAVEIVEGDIVLNVQSSREIHFAHRRAAPEEAE